MYVALIPPVSRKYSGRRTPQGNEGAAKQNVHDARGRATWPESMLRVWRSVEDDSAGWIVHGCESAPDTVDL